MAHDSLNLNDKPTNGIIRFLQAQLKDAMRDADEARVGREELQGIAKEAERKLKTLEAELLQMGEDLSASERQRRAVETERDELLEEMNTNVNKG